MGQIPIDVATLVSLLCAGVLYGIHLVTFGNVARVLLVQRNAARRRPRVYLVVATLLLLFIGSAHIVILMRRVLEAFVWYTGPGGATTALYQISNKLLNTMSILYDTQTAIGDIILVYRCYVLYRRDWRVVVLPVALWVNFLVFAVLNVHKALNLREQALLSTGSLETWATAGLSMTLALNVVTTGLMVFKIWSIQRQSTRIFGPSGRLSGRRSLDDVIIILVESGAIYTFAVVLFVALNTSQNNAEFPFAAGIPQIIGITFNLIIIRIDQGATVEMATTPTIPVAHQTSAVPARYIRRSQLTDGRYGGLAGSGAPTREDSDRAEHSKPTVEYEMALSPSGEHKVPYEED